MNNKTLELNSIESICRKCEKHLCRYPYSFSRSCDKLLSLRKGV